MEWQSFDFRGAGVDVLEAFREEPLAFLLESSLRNRRLGRYSFLGFDPFALFYVRADDPGRGVFEERESGRVVRRELCRFSPDKDALFYLRKYVQAFTPTETTRMPPPSSFGAGIMGYFSYEIGKSWEPAFAKMPANGKKTGDGPGVPECLFGFYDGVITIDHWTHKIHIGSSGLPEKTGVLRKRKARETLETIIGKLSTAERAATMRNRRPVAERRRETHPLQLQSHFTKTGYVRAVQKALEYIRRGDIYQVNLAQRFRGKVDADAYAMYRTLRDLSSSCFSAYWDAGDFQILSSSPERFLHREGGAIETLPMKGTRARGKTLDDDHRKERDLLTSAKDRAELLMITDLERNDLGRVCAFGSIKVKRLRSLEKYRTVFQTTSTVTGRLREGKDGFDALRACFPGGSITGCPKIRAMQIIDELEPSPRSIYTGSLGYMNFDAQRPVMDFNILIRTLLLRDRNVFFHTGSGIVADSDPEQEYEETLVKAQAMQDCLRCFAGAR